MFASVNEDVGIQWSPVAPPVGVTDVRVLESTIGSLHQAKFSTVPLPCDARNKIWNWMFLFLC